MANTPSGGPEPAATCAWEPFSVTRLPSLRRGAVLRVPGTGDLMLMEHRDAPSGYALVVTAGEGVGAVHLLPSEARAEAGPIATDWIRTRWTSWTSRLDRLDDALLGSGYMVPGQDGHEPRAAPALACAWEPLVSTGLGNLRVGAVIRLPGPVEPVIHLMAMEHGESPCGWALLVGTGHKAGLFYLFPPLEAVAPDGGVSTAWLWEQWTHWIDEASRPEDVSVASGYRRIGPGATA